MVGFLGSFDSPPGNVRGVGQIVPEVFLGCFGSSSDNVGLTVDRSGTFLLHALDAVGIPSRQLGMKQPSACHAIYNCNITISVDICPCPCKYVYT